jgi:hypothetical protein
MLPKAFSAATHNLYQLFIPSKHQSVCCVSDNAWNFYVMEIIESSSTISFNLPLIYLHEEKFLFPPSKLPFPFYFISRSINVKWTEKLSLRRHQKRAMWNVCLRKNFSLLVLEATNNDWTLLCNAVNSISTIFYFLMWLQFQNRFAKNSIVTCERDTMRIDGWWPYAKLFHLVYSILSLLAYQNWIFFLFPSLLEKFSCEEFFQFIISKILRNGRGIIE